MVARDREYYGLVICLLIWRCTMITCPKEEGRNSVRRFRADTCPKHLWQGKQRHSDGGPCTNRGAIKVGCIILSPVFASVRVDFQWMVVSECHLSMSPISLASAKQKYNRPAADRPHPASTKSKIPISLQARPSISVKL